MPTMTTRALLIAALAALAAGAVLVLSACGTGGKDPAALAPANAPVFVDVAVRPQGEQAEKVRGILRRFPEAGDLRRRVATLIERESAEDGTRIDYERDIESWLGERAGIVVFPVREGVEPSAAVIFDTTDEGKAEDLIEKSLKNPAQRRYRGVDYRLSDDNAAGIVDGMLVVGDERGFKAAVDGSEADQSLGESDRYTKATEKLPEDRLATIYLDLGRLIDIAARSGDTSPQQLGIIRGFLGDAAREPIVTTVRAEDDGVAFDAAAPRGAGFLASPLLLGSGTPLLGELPADAWLALGQPKLGEFLKGLVDRFARAAGVSRDLAEARFRSATGLDLNRDVLDWMGDFAAFVRGTSGADVGGGVVIQTSDEDASARALDRLGAVLRGQRDVGRVRPPTLPEVDDGFTVLLREPRGGRVHAVQRNDRVVIAFGDAAAEAGLAAEEKLRDNADFKAATGSLGAGYAPSTYIAVGPILALAETLGTAEDPEFQKAVPFIERLHSLVAGTKVEDDRLLSRTKLRLAR